METKEEGQGKESPRARMALLLLAQGYNQKQVAEKLGGSAPWVRSLMQKAWFRDKLVMLLHSKAEPSIEELLSRTRDEALMVTREMMHFAESESVRREAAATILKTTIGDKLNLAAMPKNMDELEAALKRQQDELRQLGMSPISSAPEALPAAPARAIEGSLTPTTQPVVIVPTSNGSPNPNP